MAAAVAVGAGEQPLSGTLMGYDLRITRAIDWSENQTQEISVEEWRDVIAGDTDLVADPSNGPYAVRFAESRWLDWFEGNILSTDPDHATVAKMLEIASTLSGTVQGDDGEFYDSASQWSRAPKRR